MFFRRIQMKIVFIINSISAQRCIKRVEEFIANGYEVDVFGFSRKMAVPLEPKNFRLNVIGTFENAMPFAKRLKLMCKSIKDVIRKYESENVIYYLFQLDVALSFKLVTHCNKYIYEESDLMHTYISNRLVKNLLEYVDKWIINKSILSIFTSEGFLNYHYGDSKPNNTIVVPNRLNQSIQTLCLQEKVESNCLRVGFVGFPRYKSIINFASFFCRNYKEHEFHFYGDSSNLSENDLENLKKYSNCYFHGSFRNPEDLPQIYSQIDLVLSTYDTDYENVRYAEPNKIYESIYFETPIIVSENTFLEKKIKKLGIGYSVNANNENEVILLIDRIAKNGMKTEIDACKLIPKDKCININTLLFEMLKLKLNKNER